MASTSTSTSQALAKRSSDTALMPPPPRPKRIKRPQKVLDEDDYTDALSHIIARDFFPGLIETESQQDYLNALDSQDHEWIAAAGRKLTEVMTPGPDGRRLRGRRGTSMTPTSSLYGRGGETPRAWQGNTPMSVTSTTSTTTTTPGSLDIDTGMSLSAFQTKYTSEDNESFYKLLDKQNLKKVEKYAWMWAGNKIPAPRQIAHRKREALLAANKSLDPSLSSSSQLIKTSSAAEDTRQAMPNTWCSNNPANTFMFDPSSIEDSTQTIHQAAEEMSRAPPKAVVYDNTRLRPEPSTTSTEPPPSPSLSAVQDALSGRPRPAASEASIPGSATPRINGYAFVDSAPSPSPSELMGPPLTWGGASLLGSGDQIPNPFNIKEGSKREALHHRMVEKVAKGKRSVKKETEVRTPSRTPVPRFASSPMVRKEGLTPAGQRLLERIGGTPARISGEGGGNGKGLSGLRESYTPKM